MASFSFIHAADLHLDSPFSTLSQDDPELARKMKSAAFESFENIIQLCIEREADFLLIGGDIFDGADRSLRAQVKFRDGLKRLHDAEIPSFVVFGNHDPISDWASSLEWPASACIFGHEIENRRIKRQNETLAVIQGISFLRKTEQRNLSRLFKRIDNSFHIGLLHANVGTNTGHEPYAPCTKDDLQRSGMDYWALGHVHNRRIVSREFPVAVYPGNTQGRNIREAGEKGCIFVRVNNDMVVETEFCPTDVVRWVTTELPIDTLTTQQELLETLESACRKISEDQSGRPSIARITVTGRNRLFREFKRNSSSDLVDLLCETGNVLSPPVWIESIQLDLQPELNAAELRQSSDFAGELLRSSEELSGNMDFEKIMENELAVLFDDPRARRLIDLPGPERLQDILRQATNICLAGLYDGDDP